MHAVPPRFPLTAAAYATALRTGHGRALQHIEIHGPNGLEDLIIEACLTCLVYDPQCEAKRAPWLISIVERAKLGARVIQAIETSALTPSSANQRDLQQRSAILGALAAAGSDDARSLLYTALARVPETGDVIAAQDIIALDGAEGLIHVARQFGRWLQADPDFWIDDYHLALSEGSEDGETGFAALEREAVADHEVASCLAALRTSRESRSKVSVQSAFMAYTAAEVVTYVEHNPGDQCRWLRAWGARTGSDQREVVFTALLASNEPEQAKRLFSCFAKTGAPRFDSRLLQWVDHSDDPLHAAAVAALVPLSHRELRQTAKRLIAEGKVASGVALLVNNFEAGDFALCERQLKALEDVDECHRVVGELLTLCEAHPGEKAQGCLLFVYEHSPCSTCRSLAMTALVGSNTAPAWVLAESAFDADPDTRALSQKK